MSATSIIWIHSQKFAAAGETTPAMAAVSMPVFAGTFI